MTKLNSEQLKQIKEQLMKQIINFPESQREAMKSQIDAMNDLELEDFLIKNKLINLDETGKEISQNPFRLILLPLFPIPALFAPLQDQMAHAYQGSTHRPLAFETLSMKFY